MMLIHIAVLSYRSQTFFLVSQILCGRLDPAASPSCNDTLDIAVVGIAAEGDAGRSCRAGQKKRVEDMTPAHYNQRWANIKRDTVWSALLDAPKTPPPPIVSSFAFC